VARIEKKNIRGSDGSAYVVNNNSLLVVNIDLL